MANMGPIWRRQDPGGPHDGPVNFATWDGLVNIYQNGNSWCDGRPTNTAFSLFMQTRFWYGKICISKWSPTDAGHKSSPQKDNVMISWSSRLTHWGPNKWPSIYWRHSLILQFYSNMFLKIQMVMGWHWSSKWIGKWNNVLQFVIEPFGRYRALWPQFPKHCNFTWYLSVRPM